MKTNYRKWYERLSLLTLVGLVLLVWYLWTAPGAEPAEERWEALPVLPPQAAPAPAPSDPPPPAKPAPVKSVPMAQAQTKTPLPPSSVAATPVEPAAIQGELAVQVLNRRTLVLSGAFQNFLRERMWAERGDKLKEMEARPKPEPEWSWRMFYNFAAADMIARYRPVIARHWQAAEHFTVTDLSTGTAVGIARLGYWLNPVGQGRYPTLQRGELISRNAEVIHFAYLELDADLRPGVRYRVQAVPGGSVEFTYDGDAHRSGAIKVNQVGYQTDAGRKYAYVGSWLGSSGPLELNAWREAEFHLIDLATQQRAYTGKLRERMADVYNKNGVPFTGEEVLEAEFSDFATPGRYCIEVPGIGRSGDFRIGNAAIGEAFYIHARGLYHKRCGMAKSRPYTPWEMGACHEQSVVGNFPPNDAHYRKAKGKEASRDYGFFNADGESIDVKSFKLIEQNHGEELLPVFGGWHDAADYDRRSYHYTAVSDLLAAYLMFPDNFSDNQLNLPESGNGLPDILDEVLWGMEVWRRAQTPEGGVGGWVEATSHPAEYNPAVDRQVYYLSLATRESSMQYAGHAAMLALALRTAGADDRGYLDSARRAFAYAADPAHRVQHTYRYDKETITYREPAEIPVELRFKAAFNLFLLTQDPIYRRELDALAAAIRPAIRGDWWRYSPFYYAELAVFGQEFPEFADFQQTMLRKADEMLEMLNDNYPYRVPWYAPTHGFVNTMSWGISHPLVRARTLIMAWRLTGAAKYRDAALLCNDWHNGANPFGATMTSGLGESYPVRFLDLISYSDGIEEFVPGITPYRNTYGIATEDINMAHGLYYQERADHQFPGFHISLLPGDTANSFEETRRLVGNSWPVWRRFANLESYAVAASEYTMWETIAPAAAVTGCLLQPGWLPDEALRQREPVGDITTLPGYTQLP